MREIEFRVWDGEKMHYLQDIEYFDDSINFRFSHFENTGIPLKMMLYTGFKDKNGKKIYVGDIVIFQYDNEILNGVIIYKDGCFVIDGLNVLVREFLYFYKGYIKIIGNIYENPELIKGDDKK